MTTFLKCPFCDHKLRYIPVMGKLTVQTMVYHVVFEHQKEMRENPNWKNEIPDLLVEE